MALRKWSTTIGIIEDDVLLNQALDTALRNAGYSTVCVHTRKEALSRLGDNQHYELTLAVSAGTLIGVAGIYFRQRRCW